MFQLSCLPVAETGTRFLDILDLLVIKCEINSQPLTSTNTGIARLLRQQMENQGGVNRTPDTCVKCSLHVYEYNCA